MKREMRNVVDELEGSEWFYRGKRDWDEGHLDGVWGRWEPFGGRHEKITMWKAIIKEKKGWLTRGTVDDIFGSDPLKMPASNGNGEQSNGPACYGSKRSILRPWHITEANCCDRLGRGPIWVLCRVGTSVRARMGCRPCSWAASALPSWAEPRWGLGWPWPPLKKKFYTIQFFVYPQHNSGSVHACPVKKWTCALANRLLNQFFAFSPYHKIQMWWMTWRPKSWSFVINRSDHRLSANMKKMMFIALSKIMISIKWLFLCSEENLMLQLNI